MKCQILFPWKNEKNIICLLSAEFAQRMLKGKTYTGADSFLVYLLKYLLPFSVFPLPLPNPLGFVFEICY